MNTMRLTFAHYSDSIMLNDVMTISNITTLIINLIEFLFRKIMRDQNKSPQTIGNFFDGARSFVCGSSNSSNERGPRHLAIFGPSKIGIHGMWTVGHNGNLITSVWSPGAQHLDMYKWQKQHNNRSAHKFQRLSLFPIRWQCTAIVCKQA